MGLLDSLKKMLGLGATEENQTTAAPAEKPVANQESPAPEANQNDTETGM